MVSQWIPVSKSLGRKREVLAIAQSTGRSRHEIMGILVDFWSWVDEESADGRMPAMRLNALPQIITGTDLELWSAVVGAGWLIENADGLEVTNFERWLGCSAKRRLKERLRKTPFRKISASDAEKKRPTEQNRTEQDGEESPYPSCPVSHATTGPNEPQAKDGLSAQDHHAPVDGGAAGLGPGSGGSCRSVPCSTDSPEQAPVLIFPTEGPLKQWPLTMQVQEELCELFPAVDVPGECRKALAWVLADSGHRKTAKGMRRFLTGWMMRANDRGQTRKRGGDGRGPDVGRSSRLEPPAGKYSGIGQTIGQVSVARPQPSAAVVAPP